MIKAIGLGLMIVVASPQQALAYVDPGIAGMLYQFLYIAIVAMIGWFAGFGHLFRKFFKKLMPGGSAPEPGKPASKDSDKSDRTE